ncbi:hypothetical protein [Actinomycetospora aeridis]|uniref:Uncharacterized protein n=1 Tax=Actinomycetospora aeridis TaxID=3129231 RepID=A0ABU8NAW7_9PSEU
MDEVETEQVVTLTLRSGVVIEQRMLNSDFRTTTSEITDSWTDEESVHRYVIFGHSIVRTSEIASVSWGGLVRRESAHD